MLEQLLRAAVLAGLVLAPGGAGAADDAPARQPSSTKSARAHALTLSDAIDVAFEHNPDLAASAARIGEAEAKVAEAEASFYPRVTARVEYSYSNNPMLAFSAIVAQRRYRQSLNINQPGWTENFRPEIVGSWNLYRGGQDSALKRAAELGVEAAELERSALRNRLAGAVTAAYFAVLSSPRQAEVAGRSAATVARQIEIAKARVEEGTALRADVLSLQVRATSAAEAELKAENSLELSRSALRTLLGTAVPQLFDPPQSEVAVPALPDGFDKLLEKARADRPEMQAAARQVQIREQELEAARGARLPRVNAYAAYGQNSRSPDFSSERDNGSIGVNAEVDIFAGGAISARIAAAERRLVEAQAVEQRIDLEVEDELRRAYANLKEVLQRLKVAEAGAASAEEALRLVEEQYRGGTATVTRYLEAETDRAGAAVRAIVARYETQVADAELKKSLGHWR